MSRDPVHLAQSPRNDRPGDRYRCGYRCQGGGIGDCARGPSPTGTCGSATDPCNPARTFRSTRRLAIVAMTAIALCGLAVWLIVDSVGFLKPGELSHAHAVIFANQTGADRCAACHPNASLTVGKWFTSDNLLHNRLAQTDRCVACHQVKISAETASLPHNLSRDRLSEIRNAWAEATRAEATARETGIPAESSVSHTFDAIHCATCHREHGGSRAIMTALSDAQCQSCHSRTFENFRSGHPDWDQWPHTGSKTIAFNHATHQHLHFPAAPSRPGGDAAASESGGTLGRAFDCRGCHPGQSQAGGVGTSWVSTSGNNDSEPLRTVSYEAACADCHASSLRVQSTQRLDLFALPMLPNAATNQFGDWPAAATGFFDGEIGPLARWMIAADPAVADAISRLPGDGSITQIDPQQASQVAAAVLAAEAIRTAMERFASQGSRAVAGRETDPAAMAMRQVLRSLPPQLVADAHRQWFAPDAPQASAGALPGQALNQVSARPLFDDDQRLADDLLDPADLLSSDDPLASDPLAGDPLAGDPLADDPLADDPLGWTPDPRQAAAPVANRFDPAALLPDGGWYRDDLRLAISYRGGGHADPVLKAAVELAASLPTDDPVRRGLLATSAVTSCVRCHVGAVRPEGSLWQSTVGTERGRALTKFSHRPHFHLPQLSDCTHCHQTDSSPAAIHDMANQRAPGAFEPAAGTGFQPHGHGFISLGKVACVSCHRPGAAGDHCTQCHFYHSPR